MLIKLAKVHVTKKWPNFLLGVVNSISLHSIDYYRPLAHKLTQSCLLGEHFGWRNNAHERHNRLYIVFINSDRFSACTNCANGVDLLCDFYRASLNILIGLSVNSKRENFLTI